MSFVTLLLSPFNLLFFIIAIGFSVGKLRIQRISLGISGILFVAIMVGFLMYKFMLRESPEIISSAQSTMKIFSRLGSSLFVSVIGFQTGFSIDKKSKESVIALLIGALMSTSGVLTMLLISSLDKTVSYSSLLGILSGALTSTPGLSSVCDMIGVNVEEATWGYGCAYPFGVVLVVLFSRLLSKKENENIDLPNSSYVAKSKFHIEFMLLCSVALLGNVVNNIEAMILGNTASTLFVGLIIGYVAKKTTKPNLISTRYLDAIKEVGLALFFAGTGFATGIQAISFNLKTVVYGLLITLTALLVGWLICKVMSSSNHMIHNGFVIAGGMTSSPAYGALCGSASEKYLNNFSFAYCGALLSLILAIQIIGYII